MKLNKKQLGLLYMCVADEIEKYTTESILDGLTEDGGIRYAQLNILLSELKKEIKK